MSDIENIDAYKEQIGISLADLADRLEDDAIGFAAEQALDETGFDYPLTAGSIKFWALERAKRHAIDLLRTTAAFKFKYKQISLNQRFDHLDKMIQQMDEAWVEALKTDPALMSVDTEKVFGTYLGNGFIYDQHGKDLSRLMKDLGIDNYGYRQRYV